MILDELSTILIKFKVFLYLVEFGRKIFQLCNSLNDNKRIKKTMCQSLNHPKKRNAHRFSFGIYGSVTRLPLC